MVRMSSFLEKTNSKHVFALFAELQTTKNAFPVFVLVGDVLWLTGNGFMVAEIQNADRLDNMLICMQIQRYITLMLAEWPLKRQGHPV